MGYIDFGDGFSATYSRNTMVVRHAPYHAKYYYNLKPLHSETFASEKERESKSMEFIAYAKAMKQADFQGFIRHYGL